MQKAEKRWNVIFKKASHAGICAEKLCKLDVIKIIHGEETPGRQNRKLINILVTFFGLLFVFLLLYSDSEVMYFFQYFVGYIICHGNQIILKSR